MPTDSRCASMRASRGGPPTGVVSVSGARRRAAPATRTIAFTLRFRLRPLGVEVGVELFLLALHLVDELLVRRCLDDLVELRAVTAHHADAFDDDIVHEP